MEKLGRKKKVNGPMSSNGSKSNKIVVLQYVRESSGDGHSPTLKREKRSLRGDFKLLFEIFGICWRCSNTTTLFFSSSSLCFFLLLIFSSSLTHFCSQTEANTGAQAGPGSHKPPIIAIFVFYI